MATNVIFVSKTLAGAQTTLAAAKAAAASGDLIIVYDGTYDETNLAKDGVNWHFFPGTRVIYTGNSVNGIWQVDTGMTFMVTGHGFFKWGIGVTEPIPAVPLATVQITHASANVVIEADTIATDNPGSDLYCAVDVRNCLMTSIKVRDAYTTSPGNVINWIAGEFYLTFEILRTTHLTNGSYMIWCQEPEGGSATNMWVRGNLINSMGYGAIVLAATTPNYKLWIDVHEIRAGFKESFDFAGIHQTGGKLYVRAAKMGTDGNCNIWQQGGESWYTLQKMTSDVTNHLPPVSRPHHVRLEAGTMDLDCQQFETIGTSQLRSMELVGGSSRIRGKILKNLSGGGILHTGGSHEVEITRIDTSPVNHADNHCVEAQATGMYLRKSTLVAPSLAQTVYHNGGRVKCLAEKLIARDSFNEHYFE
jgi:hypothetical protein